jgi:hypothetical protein
MPQTCCMHTFVQCVHRGTLVNAHNMVKCIAEETAAFKNRVATACVLMVCHLLADMLLFQKVLESLSSLLWKCSPAGQMLAGKGDFGGKIHQSACTSASCDNSGVVTANFSHTQLTYNHASVYQLAHSERVDTRSCSQWQSVDHDGMLQVLEQ